MEGGKSDAVASAASRRHVGGELVSATTADARSARIELLRRHSSGTIEWRFRQPKLALFWFRHGVRRFQLNVDDRPFAAKVSATSGLCFFPSHVEIDGEFVVDDYCDYTVVLFEPGLLADRGIPLPKRPVVGFDHATMTGSLRELSRQAGQPDRLFRLYFEGWAMQSLAQLSRLTGRVAPRTSAMPGGLPAPSLHRVEEYVRLNLGKSITIDDLAYVAGFSRRHFMRSFKQSVGLSPLRYVQSLRIEESKRLLAMSPRSITAIATDCGFSHLQHFSTSFRQVTGMSPSAFRREAELGGRYDVPPVS
ncbi:helix-turn-helix domain-containing protein [Streptomyces iranensis]|uniref:AraC family transcriptional regulator n=1 Tax=Streptomyces iranensis TaxID=576784 RepID=A0A060ZMM5_9ACTN|nr:helix-turn-helix domain-containing protein [Streptomyces iranensis]MBP2062602.1 AraC family transcriptional regulator [Streptomyces iranensis]CDR04346.1 transcriptional regulator, AraC family [Streptomyces iranensis]